MTSFTQADIDAKIAELGLDGTTTTIEDQKVEGRAFINGEYVDSSAAGEEYIPTSNPATGKVVAHIASCQKEDVDKAVAAARAATDEWAGLHPNERKTILLKFASLIEAATLELAVLDSVEAGKSIQDNLEGDVPETVACFQFHAEAIDKEYEGQVASTGRDKLGLIVKEAVGVVGLIVPWNFPLLMAAWKLAPALATGNCCIIKPSEMTSLSCLALGAIANQAGIPKGVLNIIPGYGKTVGANIAQHMDIDMVGFTGSTVTGRTILQASAMSNMKRVSLELGGKSPQLVFDDVEDLDRIVEHVMSAAFWNQSENCSCGSRLIVQKKIKARLLEKLVEAAKASDWTVGNPQLLTTSCGAMISPQHCDKVLGYIAKGIDEGAELVVGGKRVVQPDGDTYCAGGDFVELTIFDKVTNQMSIAQDEIFGPVLSVMEFDTEEEGIQMANDTKYGLAASLYTDNVHRAHRVSRRIRAGTVSVNCFGEGDATTPFGGYKQSGFGGRDKGLHAHEQYQELKTIWHEIYQ
jgi:gamma-glutamyl-gamma-aminobutyraldehyde dehydrogenase